MLADPEEDGWERTDFPVVCEDCLGPNPYVRMQKQDYAAECAISARPFTVFRWRPGNEARYKRTVVCREVALAKNVCQVCLLDLDYGIPVQARDAALGVEKQALPKSDVNREFATENIAKQIESGEFDEAAFGKARANDLLNKMARKRPYYNKNKAPICTFWLRNACTRNDCPYRPCNGDTNMPELSSAPELRQQNIKDRYYGINDPVAEKMLKRAEEAPNRTLVPPGDTSITTLYVGGMDERISESDLRDAFYAYGELKSIKCVPTRNCAFVTYTTRDGAEKAAEALGGQSKLVVNGIKLRLMWGKPARTQGKGPEFSGSGAAAGASAGTAGAAPVGATGMPPPMMMAPAGAVGMVPQGSAVPPMMVQGAPGAPPMMMMPMPAPFIPAAPAQSGLPVGTAKAGGGPAYYPSMDPNAMGSAKKQ